MILSSFVGVAAAEITSLLTASRSSSPRLDAELLVCCILQKDRSWLLAHTDYAIPTESLTKLSALTARRVSHEPMAYILGKQEFYGRSFKVSSDTLTPRPETETMIELALSGIRQLTDKNIDIVDVGTGSGCIAITMALEQTRSKVFATDISKPALKIAQENTLNLGAKVEFLESNLLDPFYKQKVKSDERRVENNVIILANLPYVPTAHTINKAAMQEPSVAIFGGVDGLDYYRELFDQIKKYEIKVKSIYTESLPTQHTALSELANKFGYEQTIKQDFIQVFSK